MANSANSFASLNLSKLEKCILERSYTLKFSCLDFNLRTLRLESDGNLIISIQGFTFTPCLKELEATIDNPEEESRLNNKTCFVSGIIDTSLDTRIFAGAKLTIKKSSTDTISATLEDRDINLLIQKEESDLALLLDKINLML